MTSDTRTPAEIERQIERERAGLTNTLDDLQKKFSVETIARQFSDQFREHGGDIGRSVSEAVKRNPVALALTGVGLAWLMMGDRTPIGRSYEDDLGTDRNDRLNRDHERNDSRPYRTTVGGTFARSRQTHGRFSGSQSADRFQSDNSGRCTSYDDLPSWAQTDDDYGEHGFGGKLRDATTAAGDSVSGAMNAARNAGSFVAGTAKDAAEKVTSAANYVTEEAQEIGATAAEHAAALRDRLAQGTETLAEEARNRVIAAREQAIDARDAAMNYGRQGRERAADLFDDHPLIAGALAVAVGSAIAAALPRSRTEDAYLGEKRDRLMQEAERIFADEKSKLTEVVKATTDEARKVAEEVADETTAAAHRLVDRAKEAGERISDAAKSQAKKQDVGTVETS